MSRHGRPWLRSGFVFPDLQLSSEYINSACIVMDTRLLYCCGFGIPQRIPATACLNGFTRS